MNEIAKSDLNMPSTIGNVDLEPLAFTPRLTLAQKSSNILSEWKKEMGGEVPTVGDFILGPPGYCNLGKSIMGIPLAWRNHALQLRGNEVMLESFNRALQGEQPSTPEQEVFASVMAYKFSKKQEFRAFFGKDVLWWIPSKKCFCIYGMYGTAAQEANNVHAHFGQKVQMGSWEVPGRVNKWRMPLVNPVGDGSVTVDEIPNKTLLTAELLKFNNPITSASGIDGKPR